MNEPAICLSILGPCESPSKGIQKLGTVNWSEGGTKMISHLPFYLLGAQEGKLCITFSFSSFFSDEREIHLEPTL